MGTKCSSTCFSDSSEQTLLSDSTAYFIPTVSQSQWVNCNTCTYFVPDQWLLDSSQILEGREEHVSILGATNVLDKVPEFLAQRGQHFILIFHGI